MLIASVASKRKRPDPQARPLNSIPQDPDQAEAISSSSCTMAWSSSLLTVLSVTLALATIVRERHSVLTRMSPSSSAWSGEASGAGSTCNDR